MCSAVVIRRIIPLLGLLHVGGASMARLSEDSIILNVSLRARERSVDSLRVWVSSDRGEHWELHGFLALFSLPLVADRDYAITMTCNGSISERLLVEAASAPRSPVKLHAHIPIAITLEPAGPDAFVYTRPVGRIAFREDIGGFGFVHPQGEAIPSAEWAVSGPDPMNEIPRLPVSLRWPSKRRKQGELNWLDAELRPCEKEKAVHHLVPLGQQDGRYAAVVLTLDSVKKADLSFADPQYLIAHGPARFYYPNGRVESSGAYALNVKNGVWQRFGMQGERLTDRIYDQQAMAEELLAKTTNATSEMRQFASTRMKGMASESAWDRPVVHQVTHVAEGPQPPAEPTLAATGPDRATRRVFIEPEKGVWPKRPAAPGARAESFTTGPLHIMTDITVEEGGSYVNYRRVMSYYGEVYYFRNGESCSAEQFKKGTARTP